MSTRIEKLSDFAYTVNGKLITMNDDCKYEPVDEQTKLSFQERQALADFVQCNKGKIKLRSTVK